MIKRINHVAIAVPDVRAAAKWYQDLLGASVSSPVDLPAHGVTIVFVQLPGTQVELMQSLGDDSPLAAFLERHASGGIHHICYDVADLSAARAHLLAHGAGILGDGQPAPGAHGKPVLFLHPKDFHGVLIELQQA